MVQSPDKSVEQNKEVSIRFLETLGGESLTEGEVRDLRYLSTKYPEFAELRFSLLGERVPRVFDQIVKRNFFAFFIHIWPNILLPRYEKKENVIENKDIEKAERLMERVRNIVIRETSTLMGWADNQVLDKEIIARYNNYLTRVRVLLEGSDQLPRNYTHQEATNLAEMEASKMFEGAPASDLMRKQFKDKKTFILSYTPSLFTEEYDGEENDRVKELSGIEEEITKYVKGIIKRINEGEGSEQEKRFWSANSDTNPIFYDHENLRLAGSNIIIDFFAKSEPEKKGCATTANLQYISLFYHVDSLNFSTVLRRGYHYIYALSQLADSIHDYLLNNNCNIISPKESPLSYFRGVLGLGRVEKMAILINEGESDAYSRYEKNFDKKTYLNGYVFNFFSEWFAFSRARYPVIHKNISLISTDVWRVINKFYSNWQTGIQRVSSTITNNFKTLFDASSQSNEIETGARVSRKAGIPNKESSASLAEYEDDKTISFELVGIESEEIKYLTTHPDDDKPSQIYILPEESKFEKYSLLSNVDLEVVNGKVKVWAPFNSVIAQFDLYDSGGFRYLNGRDYDLQIDSRGYYSLIFRPGIITPEKVRYNIKFYLETQKIDVINFTEESFERLGGVINKLKEAGYSHVGEKLIESIKNKTLISTADLERIIFNSSLYYFSELYSPATLERIGANIYPFLPSPSKSGKLVVICSHASLLNKEILSEVFPEGEFHTTALLPLRRSVSGKKLYAYSIGHSDLRGVLKDKKIVIDTTPKKIALKINPFKYIKSMYIDRFMKRKNIFMKALREILGNIKTEKFKTIEEEIGLSLNIEYNRQYFSSILSNAINDLAAYELSITNSNQFRVPPVVTDLITLLKLFEKEYPENLTLKERLISLKDSIQTSREMIVSPSRNDSRSAKLYLGNSMYYQGYIDEIIENMEMSLR